MPPRLGKNARGKTAPPIKRQEGATAAGTGSAATTATTTTTENPQVLPPKDAALLAQVFQQYEDKKYAAAVKTADLVLKKYPLNAREHTMRLDLPYKQPVAEASTCCSCRNTMHEGIEHVQPRKARGRPRTRKEGSRSGRKEPCVLARQRPHPSCRQRV